MTTTLRPVVWFPARGVNTAQPPHIVSMDMASEAYDCVVEDFSVLKKRDGYSTVNSSAVSASPTINSMASLYLSSGTKYEVLGTSNGGLWYDNGGTVTASIFSGLSTTRPFEYTQFLDTLLIADGTNIIKTWSGTATGQISAAATGAKFVETHLNRLFIAGMSAGPSRVDYSLAADFNTWTGAGTDQFQVEQNDGQNISGLKSFSRNELVIFKEHSMYKLLGYDKASFNLLSVDKNVGCVCNRAIKQYKSFLIWPYVDGIYIYDGAQARRISGFIKDFWETLNKTKYTIMDATIDRDKGRYILSVCTGSDTTNSRLVVVDLLHPWEGEDGELHFPIWIWRVSAQAIHSEVVSATNAQRLVFGDTTGFKYYFGTIYSDNGTSIDAYVVTPLMTFQDGIGESNCLRRIYSAWVTTAGNIEVSTEVKDGNDWVLQETIQASGAGAAIGVDFQIEVSPIGIPEATFTTRTNISARSNRVMVKFEQDSSTRYFNLQNPVELYYKTGGQRN